MKSVNLKSTPNYFGYPSVDRHANLRNDKDQIASLIKDSKSFVIPVIKKGFPVQNGNVILLPASTFGDSPNSDFIFLGEMNDRMYFILRPEVDIISKTNLGNIEFKNIRHLAPVIDEKEAALLAFAYSIYHWNHRNLYCGSCGSKTELHDAGHLRVCPNPDCEHRYFPRTDPAIITLVVSENKCLLGRQPNWPDKIYSTLAGFVEPGESLEEAVKREVYEESGIRVLKVRYHSSQPWPFPSSLMLGFISTAEYGQISVNKDELEDARWFTKEEILTMIEKDVIQLPFKLSIAYRLIKDWLNGHLNLK